MKKPCAVLSDFHETSVDFNATLPKIHLALWLGLMAHDPCHSFTLRIVLMTLIMSHHLLGLWPIYFPQGIKAYDSINLCYIFIMGYPNRPTSHYLHKMGFKRKMPTISQYLFGLVDHMIMKSTILGYWTAWSVWTYVVEYEPC